MDTLKEWAIGLCYVSCACMIAFYLIPSGKLSESAKRVISVLCLSAMTVPLLSHGFELPEVSFDEFEGSYNVESSEISEQLCEAACVCMRAQAEAAVNGIFDGEYEIFVNADIKPDNSIIINELRVVLKSGECDIQAVIRQVELYTGLTPVVKDEREG